MERFFAFRYSNRSGSYYSLFKLEREPSIIGTIKYLSKEARSLIKSKSLREEKAILVCSEKLTNDENWEEINFGNLLVINSNLKIKELKIR